MLARRLSLMGTDNKDQKKYWVPSLSRILTRYSVLVIYHPFFTSINAEGVNTLRRANALGSRILLAMLDQSADRKQHAREQQVRQHLIAEERDCRNVGRP